jgi:Zn-dependent peptidase ImmA (M78 family)
MTQRVDLCPEFLRWATERSRKDPGDLESRFPWLDALVTRKAAPTLKQLESFARATHTPVGYFVLSAPPEGRVPSPDFQMVANRDAHRPSPDLETIYICQQRQEWYRDFARSHGETWLRFVGSVRVNNDAVAKAAAMRDTLGYELDDQRKAPARTDALCRFIEQADASGVIVMCSGVVLNNNRRPLDPDEFLGFALIDDLAPLVFVNGADAKSAQMFTLAHELAHIWAGQTAVSDAEAVRPATHEVERWCNRVAAELLVPLAEFRAEYVRTRPLSDEVARLVRVFKVSTLVILRRMHDAGGLTWEELGREYDKLGGLAEIRRGSGGNFYLTQAARISKRFARALVLSTLEGQTLYCDAFRMLGFSKLETFQKLGRSLGLE